MLEKKKSSKFKRFYLLAAVTAGLFIPFLDFQFKVVHNSITETKQIVLNEIQNQIDFSNFVSEISLPIANKTSIILVVYVLICIVFGIRFLWNIDKILFFKQTGKVVQNKYGILVLHEKIKSPFSFYDAIYLNEKQWNEKQIASEILYHEQGHLRQKHTLDILFVEFLKVFFWFQPFVFVMKRLIQENHEYLADEYSLMKTQNVKHYQQLILSFYNNQTNEMQLSSSFHFNNLKKRFIMMKNTKKGRVWETIFYSSAALITYFGFVGIEAKASEILYFENEVLNLNKPIHNISSQTLNNIDTLKTKSEISEKVFVVSDSLKSKVKVTYKENGFYSSFVEINKQKLNYVVDGNKKVTFYDNKGNVVKVNKNTYQLVDLFSDDITYFSSSYSVRYNEIVDKENYTKVAEPLTIDKKSFVKDFTDIIVKKTDKIKEKKRYDLIMTFDIDTNGDIVNVQNLSTDKIDVEEHLKKYLYSQQKWAPSEINNEKVVSTFKIHFLARINYSIKEMSEEDNKETPLN